MEYNEYMEYRLLPFNGIPSRTCQKEDFLHQTKTTWIDFSYSSQIFKGRHRYVDVEKSTKLINIWLGVTFSIK